MFGFVISITDFFIKICKTIALTHKNNVIALSFLENRSVSSIELNWSKLDNEATHFEYLNI